MRDLSVGAPLAAPGPNGAGEGEVLAGRSEQRPYVIGIDWASHIALAARLCCALQRDRDLGWDPSEDADQLLEDLTRELGRFGVFMALGLVTDEPPADVRRVDHAEG